MPAEASSVDYEVTRFEICSDCSIPPTGIGHRTVYIIEGRALCEECLKHHGYTVEKGEVFDKEEVEA